MSWRVPWLRQAFVSVISGLRVVLGRPDISTHASMNIMVSYGQIVAVPHGIFPGYDCTRGKSVALLMRWYKDR